jgi:hypothetical protein
MQKLAIRGIIFLAIGLALVHLAAAVVVRRATDGTASLLRLERERVEALAAHEDLAEALVVGSSHGDDIDFSVTDLQGFQLSRAWGDVFEVRYTLDQLLPRLPRLHTVFIPISYFTFLWDNGSVEKLHPRRRHLYAALPSWQFIPGDTWLFLQVKAATLVPIRTILREDHWRGVILPAAPSAAGDGHVEGCEQQSPAALSRQAEARAREQIGLMREMLRRQPLIEELTRETLGGIVADLQARGVRVVLFTPPYYERYTGVFEDEFPAALTVLHRNVERLKVSQGAEYYDFARDPLSRDPALFADSDHLNPCGKRLFTERLGRALVVRN